MDEFIYTLSIPQKTVIKRLEKIMAKGKKACRMTSIGGQALLEGIMMKGPDKTVMATRMPDGSIDLEELPEKHLKDKCKLLGWPFIRGIFNLIDSYVVGYKALMKSAEKIGFEEEDEEEMKNSWLYRIFGDKIMGVITAIAGVLGVALALVLFMWLPTAVFKLVNTLATAEFPFSIWYILGVESKVDLSLFENGNLDFFKGLVEGILKIIIFLIYIAATALMPDIKKTYMYHGGEHKSIFCYEAGLPLTVENVRKQSRFHPRCGTSFLILILLINILISTITLMIFPGLINITWLWVVVKILLLPLICGIGYEIIRLCGKYPNWFTRIISLPGMWVQHLTTKEPKDDMIEVAIEALTAVIPADPSKDEWGK